MEQRAGLTAAKRELSKVESRRQKLLDLMLDGVIPSSEGKNDENNFRDHNERGRLTEEVDDSKCSGIGLSCGIIGVLGDQRINVGLYHQSRKLN